METRAIAFWREQLMWPLQKQWSDMTAEASDPRALAAQSAAGARIDERTGVSAARSVRNEWQSGCCGGEHAAVPIDSCAAPARQVRTRTAAMPTLIWSASASGWSQIGSGSGKMRSSRMGSVHELERSDDCLCGAHESGASANYAAAGTEHHDE